MTCEIFFLTETGSDFLSDTSPTTADFAEILNTDAWAITLDSASVKDFLLDTSASGTSTETKHLIEAINVLIPASCLTDVTAETLAAKVKEIFVRHAERRTWIRLISLLFEIGTVTPEGDDKKISTLKATALLTSRVFG